MPTTVSKTIGNGTRDYTSIASWEAAAPANLVTSDQIWEGLLYPEGAGTNGEWTVTTSIALGGSTSDSTRFKRLKAASGQSFADNGTPVLRYDTSKGVAIRSTGTYGDARPILISEANCELIGLQVKSNGANAVLTISATGQKLSSCIFESGTRTTTCINFGLSTGHTVTNCLWIGDIVTSAAASQATFTNCGLFTDQSSRTLFGQAYGTTGITLKNCWAFGYTTLGTGANAGSSYNGTDLASFTGSNNVTSLTASSQFQNSTYGSSLDLRLKSGSGLLDVGTNTGAPSTDAFGTVRPQNTTVDIGPYELVAAASIVGPLFGGHLFSQGPLVGGRLALA